MKELCVHTHRGKLIQSCNCWRHLSIWPTFNGNLKWTLYSISTAINSFTGYSGLSNGKLSSWLWIASNRNNSRIIWTDWIFPYDNCCRFSFICLNSLVINTVNVWCFVIYCETNVGKPFVNSYINKELELNSATTLASQTAAGHSLRGHNWMHFAHSP